MLQDVPYQDYKILFVDDEEKSCKYFNRTFVEDFSIITCYNAEDALAEFHKAPDDFAVIISDQRMPGITGIDFLSTIFETHPRTVRFLSTAYSDLDDAVEAVNQGRIHKYITKPWDLNDLEAVIKRGIEHVHLVRAQSNGQTTGTLKIHRLMGLSRLFSFTVVSLTSDRLKHAQLIQTFHSLFQLCYSVIDNLDLGFNEAFNHQSDSDSYRQYKRDYSARIKNIISSISGEYSTADCCKALSKLLEASYDEASHAFKDFNSKKLIEPLQGLIGFQNDEALQKRAIGLVSCTYSLACHGYLLTLERETSSLVLTSIQNDEDLISKILDDEFDIFSTLSKIDKDEVSE